MIRMKASIKRVLIALFAVFCLFFVWAGVKIQPSDKQVAEAATTYRTAGNAVSSSYKGSKYYSNFTSLNLTGDDRTDVLAVALSQVGYIEGSYDGKYDGEGAGSGNYTEYIYNYNMSQIGIANNKYWCAAFCSWSLYQSRVTDLGKYNDWCRGHMGDETYIWREISCQYWATQLENFGYYKSPSSYTPQSGDLIFFYNSGATSGTRSHIGLVVYSDSSNVYTVEGNTGSGGVNSNGDGVYFKSYARSNTRIAGYGALPYTSKSGVTKVDYSGATRTPGQYVSNRVALTASSFTIPASRVFNVTGINGTTATVEYNGNVGTISTTYLKNSYALQLNATAIETKGFGFNVDEGDGEIDFTKMAATTADFAFMKFANSTTKEIDPYFERNAAGFKTAGMDRGVLVHSSAATVAAAQTEAQWVVDTLRDMDVGQLDYPIGYVYYFPSGVDVTTATSIINAFNAKLAENKCVGMLVSSDWNGVNLDTLTCETYLLCFMSGGTASLGASQYYNSAVKIWNYSDGTSTYGYTYTAAQAGSQKAAIEHVYTLKDYPTEIASQGLNDLSAVKYAITTSANAGGTVKLSTTSAKEGTTVTVTATPNSGYEVTSIKVNGTTLSGKTFTMPAKATTVQVVFTMLLNIEGMSIRTGLPDGFRFVAQVKDSVKTQYGASATYGMIFVPSDMDSGALTVTKSGTTITPSNSKAIVVKMGTWWNSELISQYGLSSGYGVYSCALTGDTNQFPEEFFNRPITAVAFAISESGTIIYSSKVTRSIGYVAAVESLKSDYTSNATVERVKEGTTVAVKVGTDNTLKYNAKVTPTVTVGGVDATASSQVSVTYASSNSRVFSVTGGKIKGTGDGTATLTATVKVDGTKTLTATTEVTVYGTAIIADADIAQGSKLIDMNFENVTSITASNAMNPTDDGTFTSELVTGSNAISGNKSVKFTTTSSAAGTFVNSLMKSYFDVKAGGQYVVAMRMKFVQVVSGGEVWLRLYDDNTTLQSNGIKLLADGTVKATDNDRDSRTTYAYDSETGVITLKMYMQVSVDGSHLQLVTNGVGIWSVVVDDFIVVAGNYYEQGFEDETSFITSDAFNSVGSTGSLATGSSAISGNVSVKFTTTSAGAAAQWNTIMTSTLGSVSSGTTYRVSMKMKVTPPSQNAYLAFRLIGGTDVEGLYLKFGTDGTITQQNADIEASGNYAYDSKTNWSYNKTTGVLTVNVYMKAVADDQQFYLMTVPVSGTTGGSWTIITDDVSFGKM